MPTTEEREDALATWMGLTTDRKDKAVEACMREMSQARDRLKAYRAADVRELLRATTMNGA